MAKINELNVDDYLLDCVNVEPLQIQEEFVRVPRDLAYWNQRYADAYEAFLRAKVELERTEGMRRLHIRAQLEDAGVKITEALVDAKLSVDEEVYTAKVTLLEAEAAKVRLNGTLDAVRSKRDALVSIGAHIRAEMAGDPSIRNEHRAARSYDRG